MSVSQKTVSAGGLNFHEITFTNIQARVEKEVALNDGNKDTEEGLRITMVSYGATITSCKLGKRHCGFQELALCPPLERLIAEPGPYYGATVGRVANRISGGKFCVEGKEYRLPLNDGENHLHGGINGFDRKIWEFELVETPTHVGVEFSYISPDGEEGYPGNLNVKASYLLSRLCNDLTISFEALTDKATPVSLTNHTYWNLSGNFCRDVKDHTLHLNCDKYVAVDSSLIPTGNLDCVSSTFLDFSSRDTERFIPIPPSAEICCGTDSSDLKSKDYCHTQDTVHKEVTLESDSEFIARMEREEAEAFSNAVMEWRRERAKGCGKAVIIESGGDFSKSTVEEHEIGGLPSKRLREAISSIRGGGMMGIDHCFVINDESGEDGLRNASVLFDPLSRIMMTCTTSQPGLQVYTANWLPEIGSGDEPFVQHNAICLETQGLPDAVNHASFPSVILQPANEYKHHTVFSFKIKYTS